MKKILIFFAILPTFLYAGVIVKQSGERLENVTIKSVTDSEIIYIINGDEATLPKSETSAILYDDGRYEEISYQTPSYNQTIYDGNEKTGENVSPKNRKKKDITKKRTKKARHHKSTAGFFR